MLARVPAWLWLVLLLLAAFSIQDWRHRRALADLQGVIDDRAVQAIEDARKLVNSDLEALQGQGEAKKRGIQEAGRVADAAAVKKAALDAVRVALEAERGRLAAPVRRGDCARLAEIVARAAKAGYDFRPDPC